MGSDLSLLDLVVVARPELTRSAARRLIVEGGVRISDVQHVDPDAPTQIDAGDVVRVGKRRWFRLSTKH
ncbi:hypothetical protein [Tessaracoccus caeni]|uniref:hypothetical protein n=1 Tax=Tessaracoccus caeni TaxID=3031239 RepID=UPI0023DCA104|nr:hypothetical protein [Tessaracoccus caeni]MDF1487303.1 hypothetical protein [Tessaracoccus caeni]